jgi:hypothetical protein
MPAIPGARARIRRSLLRGLKELRRWSCSKLQGTRSHLPEEVLDEV